MNIILHWKKGDLFYIHVLDEIYAYKVDQIDIILPDEISLYLQTEADKDWITLMTYTPYGVNTHRLLVRGERT
ncbi:sortase [Amedibacillus dolichus]|uniref:sortase n=1 Tax=Amedibacillus dolichus TaxID=31971 RepID=UPI0034656AD4